MLSLAIFSSEGGFFLSFGRDAHLARRTPREGGKVFWELDLNSCACGVRDARLDGGVVVSRVFEAPLFRFVALVHRRRSPREF